MKRSIALGILKLNIWLNKNLLGGWGYLVFLFYIIYKIILIILYVLVLGDRECVRIENVLKACAQIKNLLLQGKKQTNLLKRWLSLLWQNIIIHRFLTTGNNWAFLLIFLWNSQYWSGSFAGISHNFKLSNPRKY